MSESNILSSNHQIEFRKIFELAAVGMAQVGLDGKFLYLNKRFCDLLGYSLDELQQFKFQDVTHPEDLQNNLAMLRQILQGQVDSYYLEKRYIRKDGGIAWVSLKVSVARQADGAPQYLVAVVESIDKLKLAEAAISERKAAENALKNSQLHLAALFEQSAAGVCETDMAGRITAVNDRYCKILGRTREELIGEKRQNFTHPDDIPKSQQLFEALLATKEPYEIEKRYVRPDGSFVWVKTAVNLIRQEDGTRQTSVLAVVLDITKLKQIEEKLVKTDRRKDEFLATLAHELRNPLAPIRTGLELLRLSQDRPEAIARVRDVMERQVVHLVRLIDDLLDVARINTGKIELKKERVELKTIVSSAVETNLPAIETARHDLVVNIPAEPIMLNADPTRLSQILSNLLNNATKYTRAGGRIEIAARRAGREVEISVSDNGTGIPRESLTAVFDMFTQIRRNALSAQSGLGIGLSIVRRLVNMHGGTIEASSEGIGKGSTFTIRLPLADQLAATVDKKEVDRRTKHAANAKRYRVLVADDNIDAAETLSAMLEIAGHTTHVAYDGIEAANAADQFHPEVAFIDIGMPGMNGYEVARAIRKRPDLSNTVLVAVTGWGADNDRAQSRDAGFDYHLTKPVEFPTVAKLLSSHFESANKTAS
jgi:PAS domain S-box-containing protein